jgi:hypothetical protein
MAGAAAAALLAATHAGAGRPQTPAADTYSWRFKFTKNDIHRYRVKTEYTGSLPAPPGPASNDPQPSNFHIVGRSVARQEVHKVNDDGQASLIIIPENPSFENNGQSIPNSAQANAVTARVETATGIVTGQSTTTTASSVDVLDKWAQIIYSTPVPTAPVKIGDSWKAELANPFISGAKVTLVSTLVGKEAIGDTETLKVKVEATIQISSSATDKDVIHETGTYNVDPEAGRLIRMDSHLDKVQLPTAAGSLIVKLDHRLSVYVQGGSDTD